jgi:RimJ/RimL family protein N-acetyltransferase
MSVDQMQEKTIQYSEKSFSKFICGEAPVVIRPVQEEDIPLIQEMHQRLSPNSLYLRYLSPSIPSAQDLEFQCALNGKPGFGIVATVVEQQEQVVGVACCMIDPNDPTRGEPAILVEDRYQGRGLGKQMLEYFYQQASRMGLQTIVCHTDPSNLAVLNLIKSSGLRYKTKFVEGLREITIWLNSVN